MTARSRCYNPPLPQRTAGRSKRARDARNVARRRSMIADHPTSLSEVKEWIARHREPLLALLDQLPPEQRDELRDPAGWAPKDHLAHLTMWERSMLYLLTRRPRHEGLGIERDLYLSHDVDAINDVIYHQHRDRDWESVRAGFDAVHGELLATLDEI